MNLVEANELLDSFKKRHSDLSSRTKEAPDPASLLPEVEKFIQELRAAGRHFPPGPERDLLRSLASFWATYVYQHSETGRYPSVELEPFLGTAAEKETGEEKGKAVPPPPFQPTVRNLVRLIGLPILGIAIIAVAAMAWRANIQATQIPTPTFIGVSEQLTRTAKASTPTPQAATQTSRALSITATIRVLITTVAAMTHTPATISTSSLTPTPSPTRTPGSTITQPSPTDTPLPIAGISIQVTNLVDGQEVQPQMTLEGSYANLRAGWKLYLLLQSFSKGPKYYPIPIPLESAQQSLSGKWKVDVRFGEDNELKKPETYILTLAVATEKDSIDSLNRSTSEGIANLPAGALTSPQIISNNLTLKRGAYDHLHAPRLLYFAYSRRNGEIRLISTRPDGSDPRSIPIPENQSLVQACISPSGQKIAFIAYQMAPKGNAGYSLWIMESNGQNPTLLVQQAGAMEKPSFSPNGQYILYSAVTQSFGGTITPGTDQVYNLYIYDTFTGQITQLSKGQPPDRYPAWMPDGKAVLFTSVVSRTFTLGLMQLSLSDGKLSVFYDTKAAESQAAVSPDGSMVAFVASETDAPNSNRDIYLLEPKTQKVTKLTTDDALDQSPVWDTGGKTIFFISYRSGYPQIWSINMNGKNERPVTTGGDSVSSPFVGLLDAYFPLANP